MAPPAPALTGIRTTKGPPDPRSPARVSTRRPKSADRTPRPECSPVALSGRLAVWPRSGILVRPKRLGEPTRWWLTSTLIGRSSTAPAPAPTGHPPRAGDRSAAKSAAVVRQTGGRPLMHTTCDGAESRAEVRDLAQTRGEAPATSHRRGARRSSLRGCRRNPPRCARAVGAHRRGAGDDRALRLAGRAARNTVGRVGRSQCPSCGHSTPSRLSGKRGAPWL